MRQNTNSSLSRLKTTEYIQPKIEINKNATIGPLNPIIDLYDINQRLTPYSKNGINVFNQNNMKSESIEQIIFLSAPRRPM